VNGSRDAGPPRRQRVAAYAVIVREGLVLLSRLAPYLAATERWTLPGGGIDFGEHPRDGVVREIYEETGLHAWVSETALVDSARREATESQVEMHAVRFVFEGWVSPDSPEPRVVEVDGSTVDARWIPVADVLSGAVDTVPLVRWALERHRPARRQRLAARAVVVRDGRVLLTRNSVLGPLPGRWTLPGGGVEHGESPSDTVRREVLEETGLQAEVGPLLGTLDEQFTGTAPDGRWEDFHGIELVFAASVEAGEPRVEDPGGTVDAVAWHPVADVTEGRLPTAPLVVAALALARTE
jgi:8-oxo-dGTP diphosphatase